MILDLGKLSLVTHDRGFFFSWDMVIFFEWPKRDYSRYEQMREEAVRERQE